MGSQIFQMYLKIINNIVLMPLFYAQYAQKRVPLYVAHPVPPEGNHIGTSITSIKFNSANQHPSYPSISVTISHSSCYELLYITAPPPPTFFSSSSAIQYSIEVVCILLNSSPVQTNNYVGILSRTNKSGLDQ